MIIFLLVAIHILFDSSTDLYLPSLPEMAYFFNVSDPVIQRTLSSYLWGFALAGLFGGSFSDHFGRRPIILLALTIFVIGSLICWISTSIIAFIIARFIQGLGGGAAIVVAIAIVKDCYDNAKASKIFSQIGMVVALSPMIAPIVGGEIGLYWGWRAIFLVILSASIVTLLICYKKLPESLSVHEDKKFSWKKSFSHYFQLLKNFHVVGFASISAIIYAALWCWIAEGPFFIIKELHIPPHHYGYYAAIGPIAYIMGTILNQRLVEYMGIDKVLRFGLIISNIGVFGLIFVLFYLPVTLVSLYTPLIVFAVGMALVFANATTCAVDVEDYQRGCASAILSTFEIGFAGITVFIVGLFHDGGLMPAATLMCIGTILAFIVHVFINKKKQEQTLSSFMNDPANTLSHNRKAS
ncbi:MAG: multidrug effflux MFS transporter [Proteobacteria bacterium]|nr:multidrug effflux MFS transporter [Pseudomonadota bacterium]